jgi:hypothetical protein
MQMFASLKEWMNRQDSHDATMAEIEQEAKKFKIPGEGLPQAFKYIFFIGLAILNVRLFAHIVPGGWGYLVGLFAIMGEAMALYCAHYFSRTDGPLQLVLGIVGGALMIFSLVHGLASLFDMIGVVEFGLNGTVATYSRVFAAPILGVILLVGSVLITLTHPKNIIRLKQAAAHMRVAIGRAEVASEMEVAKQQAILDNSKLERYRQKNRHEADLLEEVRATIQGEQRKKEMLAQIDDPEMREKFARDLGVKLPPIKKADADQTSERSH